MILIQKALGYLINSFQKENFRLYQVLTALNDQETKLVDQGNQNESIAINFEYRFQLPGVLAVGTDVYPVWKQVRLPLDSSNNTIGNGQQITRIDINAKVAPGASDYIGDILVTQDKGATFNSIFGPDNTQKLILPKGLTWIKYGGTYLSRNVLQDGWWFRVDNIQADGTVAAVEIVMRGLLVL